VSSTSARSFERRRSVGQDHVTVVAPSLVRLAATAAASTFPPAGEDRQLTDSARPKLPRLAHWAAKPFRAQLVCRRLAAQPSFPYFTYHHLLAATEHAGRRTPARRRSATGEKRRLLEWQSLNGKKTPPLRTNWPAHESPAKLTLRHLDPSVIGANSLPAARGPPVSRNLCSTCRSECALVLPSTRELARISSARAV